MKKKILLLMIIISNFTFAKSGKISISGNIKNHSLETIRITFIDNKELAKATVNESGIFNINAKIEHGFYLLKYGRNTAYIYLYPKDKIDLTFDANNFTSTLTFKGVGSNRNNYLVEKSRNEAKLTEDLESFYKVDEIQYLKNIQDLKDSHINLLSKYQLNNVFKNDELKSLEYERLLYIKNFKNNTKFYLGEDITTSKNFTNPVYEISYNNLKEYKKQPYYRYLLNSCWSKKIDDSNTSDEMLRVLRKAPSQEVAIILIEGCFTKISKDKNKSKEYLKLIKKVTNHKPFIEAAEKKYKKAMASEAYSKGKDSPKFSYESIDGSTISLEDFKGKYIYIDVWATWCGPCIKQIPYLKKLEARYKDKNIVFISISVDKLKMKENWKNFVNKKELGGVQLFADNSFDSDFMNAYNVTSIPRFIIIDDKGKILDPEAPRPSFQKTIDLLDDMLK